MIMAKESTTPGPGPGSNGHGQ